MKRILIFLTILMVATAAYAKGVADNTTIQASAYPDGILFEVKGGDVDLQLSVSGPGNIAFTQRHAYADSVFLDIKQANGKVLADGLYKYDAWPVPAVTISREESSKMQDRNVLNGKTDAKVSPFSGTFRIVNGEVIDPDYDEFDDLLLTEAVK